MLFCNSSKLLFSPLEHRQLLTKDKIAHILTEGKSQRWLSQHSLGCSQLHTFSSVFPGLPKYVKLQKFLILLQLNLERHAVLVVYIITWEEHRTPLAPPKVSDLEARHLDSHFSGRRRQLLSPRSTIFTCRNNGQSVVDLIQHLAHMFLKTDQLSTFKEKPSAKARFEMLGKCYLLLWAWDLSAT